MVKYKTFQMRVDDEFIEKVDELRRNRTGFPSRAEVIRVCIEGAYKSEYSADAIDQK